ncbi:MAG TPA: LytTR family DNA-binding domain-containing protein [Puia sp.]|nr:LytTR family DNA-binding domain-containing protein [Puia sp.]
MIRSILIDDERHCIDRLTGMLQRQHAGSIEILGAYFNSEEGEKAIRTLHPDLVFLDIQIGDASAFDMLRRIDNPGFEVIFTTAYDEYALEAFRFSAIDYLLKPIDPARLSESLKKLEKRQAVNETHRKLDTLFHNLQAMQGASRRICVPVVNGLIFIEVGDIIRCQAEVNYTILFLKDKQKITVAKTLGEFEHLLKNANFFRVHNSHLVNLACIKSYHKGKGGFLTMTDQSQVEVSTRRKDEFLRQLSSL